MSPSQQLAVAAVLLSTSTNAFSIVRTPASSAASCSTTTALHMGLFDGVKEAFSAPALERSGVKPERETPIDRWMGWSVVSEDKTEEQASGAASAPSNFVDAMDEANYVAVDLSKPMGIVFEENDADYGGIFVQSLKEGGAAAALGDGNVLQPGDQLVAVDTTKVSGLAFDDALGTIVDSQGDTTKLVLFRGSAKQFYGPTGAGKAWLEEFIAKGGVDAVIAAAPAPAPVEEEKTATTEEEVSS